MQTRTLLLQRGCCHSLQSKAISIPATHGLLSNTYGAAHTGIVNDGLNGLGAVRVDDEHPLAPPRHGHGLPAFQMPRLAQQEFEVL